MSALVNYSWRLFPGYVDWLFSFLDPHHIGDAIAAFTVLASGSNLFFWAMVYFVVRYQLPTPLAWLTWLIRPQVYSSPSLGPFDDAEPLVSVIIAGRNPGEDIVPCIRSVLESDYRNVEVIFADDYSTDNTVVLARQFERTGRVRVFANGMHSGKQVNLNLALMLARGEFVFQLDSDSQLEKDTLHKLLPYFQNPQVGAVCPSIHVRNYKDTLLTRFQRIEYMLMFTLVQMWRAPLGAIVIISGMGGMFRTRALRELGGYDPGLGEDTDITLRLRKAGWQIQFALEGRIKTTVPRTLRRLLRQRSRWTRNMVKIRLRKHRDLGSFRYGVKEALIYYENVLNRTLIPEFAFMAALSARLLHGSEAPQVIAGLYWLTTIMLFVKCLIASDVGGEPTLSEFWLIFFYPLYRLPIFLTQVIQIWRELLHIKPWHPYVPKHIWSQIPHR